MDFRSLAYGLGAAVLLTTIVSLTGGKNARPLEAAPTEQKVLPPVPAKAVHGKHVFAGKIPPPGIVKENPFTSDPTAVTSGRQLFSAMHCDGCHAAGGVGAVGPNLTDGRWRYGGSGAELFESIYAGRTNGMPAYGGTTSHEAIWLLVSYLKSLTPPSDPATASY